MTFSNYKIYTLILLLLSFSGWGVVGVLSLNKVNPEHDNLSPNLAYSYVKTTVWYHSRGKLIELRGILESDIEDSTVVKRRIRNMLLHRTSVYLREFNGMKMPIVGVGDAYESLFDFDGFLEEVYPVSLDKTMCIDNKINIITDIMEAYQNRAADELLTKMSE